MLQARRLSVSDDMEPVVEFLRGQSLTDKQIAAIVVEHPPTLSYSIPDRLQPFVDCLAGVGVDDIARVCCCGRMQPTVVVPCSRPFIRNVLTASSTAVCPCR